MPVMFWVFLHCFGRLGGSQDAPKENTDSDGHVSGWIDFTKHQELMI